MVLSQIQKRIIKRDLKQKRIQTPHQEVEHDPHFARFDSSRAQVF